MTPEELDAELERLDSERDTKRKGHELAKKTQQLADKRRLAELEDEHGFERILRIDLGSWRADEGAATMIVVRVPKASEAVFKRFQQQANADKVSASKKVTVSEQLGKSCLVYPHPADEKELYEATIEMAPGILNHAANQITKAVQGRAIEEGK